MRYILILVLMLLISATFIFYYSESGTLHRADSIERLYNSAKYVKLQKVLEKKIKEEPNNPKLYRYLWRAYLYSGKTDKAVQTLKKMSKLFENKTDTFFGLCFTYHDIGNFTKAIFYCKKLITINPHALSVHRKIIDLYLKYADLDTALVYINSIKNKLNDLEKTVLLAETYKISKETDKLLRLLNKARYKYPKSALIYFMLATEYYRRKEYLKSISFFDAYFDTLSNEENILDDATLHREEALIMMAKAYEEEQMFYGARKIYKKLACLYAKEGKPDFSTKMIKRTAALGLMDSKGFVSQEKFLKEFTKIQNFVKEHCEFSDKG